MQKLRRLYRNVIFITVSAITTGYRRFAGAHFRVTEMMERQVMIEKLNNETMGEQACVTTELTDNELANISGGIADDGMGNVGFCGTKPPGWHPPVVHRS